MSWEELRAALRRLSAEDHRPLSGYPDPGAVDHPLPASVSLRPWALEAARELHERFDGEVTLTVGFLPYPLGPVDGAAPTPDPSRSLLLDPADVEVVAAEPLVVQTGEDLRAELHVTNHRASAIHLSTGGSVVGRVLDPSTGEVVGGFSGWVAAVARLFTIEPRSTARVPLVVGTASYKRSLGYAVPPGEWLVEVVLRLGEEERRAPPLPLRIVERGLDGPLSTRLV